MCAVISDTGLYDDAGKGYAVTSLTTGGYGRFVTLFVFLFIGLVFPVFTEVLGAQVFTGVVAEDGRVFLIAARVQTFLLSVRASSLLRWRLAPLLHHSAPLSGYADRSVQRRCHDRRHKSRGHVSIRT